MMVLFNKVEGSRSPALVMWPGGSLNPKIFLPAYDNGQRNCQAASKGGERCLPICYSQKEPKHGFSFIAMLLAFSNRLSVKMVTSVRVLLPDDSNIKIPGSEDTAETAN